MQIVRHIVTATKASNRRIREPRINQRMFELGDEPAAIRELCLRAGAQGEIGADNVFDFQPWTTPSVPLPSPSKRQSSDILEQPAEQVQRIHARTRRHRRPQGPIAESLNRRFGTAYAAENPLYDRWRRSIDFDFRQCFGEILKTGSSW